MGRNPGKIVVQGSGNNLSQDPNAGLFTRENRPVGLEVQEKTLALVSAEIDLNGGNLTSRGGGIELGSIGDNQTVSLNFINNDWNLDYSEVTDFRDINLNAAASLDASGIGGGRIQIQGQNLFLREGSAILSFTQGNQPGQNMTIRTAERIEISGSSLLDFVSRIGTVVNINGSNNSGDVTVETDRLTLSEGTFISTSTFGQGNAGDLTIRATESVNLMGLRDNGRSSSLLSFVDSGGIGDGGNLTIETGQLTLSDGANVLTATFGQGNAGNLTISATESVNLSGLDGNGGLVH